MAGWLQGELMPRGRLAAACAAFLLLFGTVAAAQDTDDPNWPCYDPRPGHPTAREKQDFVQDISRDAIAAEGRYKVPAPAIAAMAILESGYGFTRTALFANNLFGYKWTGPAQANAASYFVLTCQPAWDVGNRYIRFADRQAAVDHVARRLAVSRYYREDTQRFAAAIAAGTDRKAATDEWVAGIADPYNYKPARYVKSLIRVMNDPIAPGDTLNPARTLYRLAP